MLIFKSAHAVFSFRLPARRTSGTTRGVDYMPNIWLITSTEPSESTSVPAFITS